MREREVVDFLRLECGSREGVGLIVKGGLYVSRLRVVDRYESSLWPGLDWDRIYS